MTETQRNMIEREKERTSGIHKWYKKWYTKMVYTNGIHKIIRRNYHKSE